jgi:pimeloyl-ACP methyl ester carboxylesterase
VDGFNWHYVDTGNSTGTVILFLHGLPEGWYSWRHVLPLVNQSFRLIALDMKGYGRSSTGPGDTGANATNFDWKVISQQILDLMSSLNISKFYVVGHDWGSIIGSLLVTQFPDHVLGFIRMEAPITLATVDQTNSPQFILFRSARMGALFMGDAQWFIDNVYSSRMLKPFNATDQMYITYEFARPGVAERIVQYFSTRNLQYMPDLFARLCNTTWPFPILLLQADSDPAQPKSYFDGLSTTCSHVQLQWITEASHFSNFDQPGQVAAAINAFVN